MSDDEPTPVGLRSDGAPKLADERFKPGALMCKSSDELREMRRIVRSELPGQVRGSKRYKQLQRQVAWLDARLREREFFRQLRRARGVPESKEERVIMFSRAFLEVARQRLEPSAMAELCKAAECAIADARALPVGGGS